MGNAAPERMATGKAIVAACLGARDAAASPPPAVARVPWGDWPQLARLATEQGVAPLLHRRLHPWLAAHREAAPTAAALRDAVARTALRGLVIRAELARALRALRSADIDVIVLKGAYLAEHVYADVALRPMGDIDLLVREADLPAAGQILSRLGYAPHPDYVEQSYGAHHHECPMWKDGTVPIELHRGVILPNGPLGGALGGLWERAVPARVAGVDVLALCPEDLLAHLCLHVAYNHRFLVSLLQLHDIAATIRCFGPRLDWTRLGGRAGADGSSRFVYCTLQVVRSLFGVPLPDLPPAILRHERTDEEMVAVIRASLLGPQAELPVVLQELGAATGLRRRLRVLARAMVPARHDLARRYDVSPDGWWVPLYYLVGPVGRLARVVRRAHAAGEGHGQPAPGITDFARRYAVERWIDRGSADRGVAPEDA